MGSAYLCAEAGISAPVIENQAAYVAGWLKKLHDDRKLVMHAAAQAQQETWQSPRGGASSWGAGAKTGEFTAIPDMSVRSQKRRAKSRRSLFTMPRT